MYLANPWFSAASFKVLVQLKVQYKSWLHGIDPADLQTFCPELLDWNSADTLWFLFKGWRHVKMETRPVWHRSHKETLPRRGNASRGARWKDAAHMHATRMHCEGHADNRTPFEGAMNASPLEETMAPRPGPFVSAVAFNRISTFTRENAGRRSATAGAKMARTGLLLFFSSHNGFCRVLPPTYEIQSKLRCSILSMAGAGWMVQNQSARAQAA